MKRETGPKAGSQVSTAKCDQRQCTVATEVIPRIQFAGSLALRTALDLDGLDGADVLTAIASILAIAEQWAVAS